jgi:hypothetical protein
MANKVNKDAFKKLKKLSIEKRIEVANSPVGASMLALLTPSQFADLFPRYYQEGLPDVGGFRAAISKKSQEKQQDILSGLAERGGGSLEDAERTGRQRREGSTGGGGGGSGRGGYGNVKGSFSAAQYAATLRQAGFKESDIALMTAVGMQESAGNVGAANDKNPARERSYGLWQININAHPFDSPEMRYAGVNSVSDLNDPVKNAKVAYYLYYKTGTGIRHWGGYTDGGYKQYLGTAQAAAAGRAVPSGGETTPQGGGGGGTPAGGNMVGKSFANAKGNTECATYAQQAGGVGHTSGWKPGQSASAGGLKPGDWVAAFHGDKYMNIRNREDPGNGSHVARFESYIYDNNGKIIGMNVTHQYNGSGGVIPGKFMFGSGGEFDAGRYHQIVDRGSPASMSVSDGSDAKVQERQKFYKQNPQADDSDQVSKAEAQGQTADVKPAIQVAPPAPHPAANQTADLNETIKLHKEKFLNEIEKKKPMVNAPLVGPGREGAWKMTIDELKKAGLSPKETSEGLEITMSRKDPRYKEAIDGMRNEGLDPKTFLDKIKYTPGEDQATASTHSQAMRSKIEGYYGQKISDHEYDMLLRATHAESSAKRHVPEEHAMIMGTILNRAKKDGSIEKTLMKKYQFESVTGRTKGHFSPNPAYKAGPGVDRMGSMYKGVMDHLHNVSPDQRYFTSEKGDKSGWHAKMVKMGGDVHGGTRFGTKLGTEVPPEVKVAQAPPPPTGIPLEQTRPQEPTATTPKPTVEPPKPPSTMEKIGKELFPGGGTKAEAGVTVAKPEATTSTPSAPPAPTTTPAAAPTPVTPTATMPSEKVAGVTGAATGGAFDVGDGGIKAFPIDGLRGDNTLVVNKKEQPLFTMNSNEPAVYDPSKNRVDVIPKTNGNAMGPSVDGIRSEFDALRQEIGNKLSDAGRVPTQQQARPIQEIKNDMPSFINDLTNQNKTPYQNPAAARAYARTRFGEGTTRDPTNDYTFGNTNV